MRLFGRLLMRYAAVTAGFIMAMPLSGRKLVGLLLAAVVIALGYLIERKSDDPDDTDASS